MTNDRRVWLPFGDGGWSKLGVFDLANRTFSQIPTSSDFYDGPRLAASGNGERLLVDSRFLDLHLDGADGTLKPGCPYFNWGLTSDEAGSRFLAVGTSGAALFDASLASAGSCAMPASYVQYKGGMTVAAVVSPDGSRAYMLSYSPATLDLARVWVCDATATGTLPLLGYFELPEYPTVRDGFTFHSYEVAMAITPDAAALLIAGDDAVMVVPVPSTLTAP